jgi:hypothetical protein
MKTKVLLIACLAFFLSSHTFSQNSTEKKSKAEYVVSLVSGSEIVSVRMSSENYHRSYSVEWLYGITVKDGLLIFRKGNLTHAWDIEDAVVIEKIDDYIVIRLPDRIGLDWF